MEVAARWSQHQEVGIAMPRWAYQLHSQRLAGVHLFETGWFVEQSPPRSLAALSVRYALRSLSRLGLRTELVVAASHYPYDLIPALVIGRRRRIPLVVYVFHLASMFRSGGFRAGLVGNWERLAVRLLRQATLVLVDNTDVRRALVAGGIAEARVEATWNAAAPAPANTAEARRHDEVVFCGRISDTKGWRDLVTVGERLREVCPGTVLRVLGEGEHKKDLERAVTDRGLGDVVRTEGFVDEETKWRALRRAAAFISPSREEGWGIAVSEAIQAGAEVVCYDLPVYREVNAADRMHLVPLGNAQAFAERVADVVLERARPTQENAASQRVPDGAAKTWDEIARHEFTLAFGRPYL